MSDERVRGQKLQEGAPPAERRYRSPTIGEIFRRAGGIEVPEAMKEAARVSARSSGDIALTRVFEGLGSVIGNVDKIYDEVINSLRGASYTLEDIQPFIDRNAEALRPNGNSGLIISAMINNIIKEGDKIEIDPNGLLLDSIGYKLPRGELILNGNAGAAAGSYMSGGTLTINGSAGYRTGDSMSGGTLTLNGNAGDHVGDHMSGGTLTIKGDAGNSTGYCMSGGILTIKGDAGSVVGRYTNQSAGTIVIEGEAESVADRNMRGGKLSVNGEEVK